jgi:DNA (cytosine-5)-methyltransferase 1
MGSETDLCVAVDCRNFNENPEISGTLQAKESGGYSLNSQNPIRAGHIGRRLTPTECERLMGLQDGWTEYGYDGKRNSDTARYMMLGNSAVAPCIAYIMMGIAQAHNTDNIVRGT